jgi:aminoglycoside phosphotransferase (APT) family kinase protein
VSAALQNDQTSAPPAVSSQAERPVEKLPFNLGRLEAYLTRTLGNFRAPIGIGSAPERDDASSYIMSTPDGRFELRCAPTLSSEDAVVQLGREFRILAALSRRNFPVAQPLLLCEESHVIGMPFFVMSRPEGRVMTDPSLPGLTREQRSAIYEAMNTTLAQLHAFDPTALGVGSLNRLQHTISSHIQRWSERYTSHRLMEIDEMEQLMAWLPTHLPPERPPRLVHGDFRLSKLVFHPTEPCIIAVRDWENAGMGDAIADAVYHFLTWIIPPSEFNAGSGSLMGYNLKELGIPSLESYVASYAKRVKLG